MLGYIYNKYNIVLKLYINRNYIEFSIKFNKNNSNKIHKIVNYLSFILIFDI